MRPVKVYHHFRKELIDPMDRVAKCERYIVDLLLHSNLPDSERESSVCWELKHQASTLQFARILALKRGLPVDICAVGLMFHDIYSVVQGQYKDHAHLGTPIAMRILKEIGGFSEEELNQISGIIYNHSDKHIWTDDPFQEIGKDVDVLDCFLYEGAFDYYLANKPLPIFKEYLERAKRVWKELGLPSDPRFDLLDDYESSWFQHMQTIPLESMRDILAILLELSMFKVDFGICPPPFCIFVENGKKGRFYANQQRWENYVKELASQSKSSTLDEKLKIISSILSEFLMDESSIKILDQTQALVKEGIILNERFDQATNILLSKQAMHDLQNHALLFWPLIDIYELLYGEKMINRLQELGIKATQIKKEEKI